MLKKFTVVTTALLMGGLSTAYGQRNIRTGDLDVSNINPAVLTAERPTFDYVEGVSDQITVPKVKGDDFRAPYLIDRFRSASDNMLAIPDVDPFFAYSTEFDEFEEGVADTSFIITHPVNLDEEGEPERLFLVPFGDFPGEFRPANGQGWRAIGGTQIIPAWNTEDPDAMVRIDSIAPLMIVPGGVLPPERPGVQNDWVVFPFIINPDAAERDIFADIPQANSPARLFERIFDDVGGEESNARLTFMDVNGNNGFFPIPAQDINEAIELNAAGTIISINRLVIHTPGLEYPAGSHLVFVFVPENYDSPDVGTDDNERVRIVGGWEWQFGDNSQWGMGGLFRHNLDAAGNKVNNTDVIIDMHNVGLSFAGDNVTRNFPYMLQQRLRFNLDIAVFGEYMGDLETAEEWPFEDGVIISVREDEAATLSGLALGQVFPNPAVAVANIPFSLDRQTAVSLQISNILGEVVFEESRASMAPGSYIWDIETGNIAEGTYIYTMTAGGQKFSGKMAVMR